MMMHYVYAIYDHQSHMIYIGCSSTPHLRFTNHKSVQRWGHEAAGYVVLGSSENRQDALEIERALITLLAPPYNVQANTPASVREPSERPIRDDRLREMHLRIEAAIAGSGLTVEQIADRAGKTTKTLARWRDRSATIKIRDMTALALACDVDPTWLLVGDHHVVMGQSA